MDSGPAFDVALVLDPAGYEAGAKRVQKASGTAGGSVSNLSRHTDVLKKSLGALGIAVSGVALVQLARQSVQLAATFDQSLTRITTLVGVSRAQVNAWGQDLLRIAVDAGRSPNELAKALYNVTSAGQSGAAALEIVRSSAKAAAIGLGDTDTVARAVTAAMNAYGPAVLSAGKATDILVGIVKTGAAEADTIAPVLGRVVGIAAQLGISFEQLGAFIAVYTRLGVSAEESTTALRGVMTTLLGPTKLQEQALASVGLTMAKLRQEITDKGLAAALADLVAKFSGNEDALNAVIPNVRALAGILGTAGSQGEAFKAVAAEISAGIGKITDEAFDLNRADPAQIFRRLSAAWEAAQIQFGRGLLGGLTEGAGDLTRWLDENGERIAAFGRQVGEVAKKIVENIDLIRYAIIALIGLKVVGWATAAATSLKGIGSGATIAWLSTIPLNKEGLALARTWAGVVALDVKAWAVRASAGLGPLVLAIVAVGVVIDQVIDKWKALLQQDITRIAHSTNLWAGTLTTLRDAIRQGYATESQLLAINQGRAKVVAEIAKLQERMPFLSGRERDAAEDTLETHKKQLGIIDQLSGKVRTLPRVYEDTVTVVGNLNKAITNSIGLSKEQAGAIEKLAQKLAGQQFIGRVREMAEFWGTDVADAVAAATVEVELWNQTLDAGFDPLSAAGQRFFDFAGKVKLAENNLRAAELAAEAVKEASDRLAEAPELGGPLGAGPSDTIDSATLDKLTAQYHKMVSGWRLSTADMRKIWDNFLEGVQSAFASAFYDLFSGSLKGFEDLWKRVKELALRTLSEIAAKWATQTFVTNVTDSGTDGTNKIDYSKLASAAAKVAPYAAVAAIVLGIGYAMGWWGSRGREGVAGVTFAGGDILDASGNRSKNIETVMKHVREAIKGITSFLSDVGLEIEKWAEVVVSKRNQTYFINGIQIAAGTAAELEDAIAAMAIRTATFGDSVSALVQAVIRGSSALTTEQLKAEIALAQQVESFGRTELEQAVRSIGTEMNVITAELARLLGGATGDLGQLAIALGNTAAEEIRRWQQAFDQITGRVETPEEQLANLQAQARVFNAERQLRIADLRARVLDLEAQRQLAETRARLNLLGLTAMVHIEQGRMNLERARIIGQRTVISATGALYAAEEQLAGAHFSTMDAIVATAATALDIQIAATNELIASLLAIPTIDVAGLQLPRGAGGGGGRRQQRADLTDQLQQIVDGAVAALAPLIDSIHQISDLQAEIARLGPDADLAARALAVLQQQLAAQIQDAYLTLAERLATLVGDEGELAALQEIRYDLERAQLAAQVAAWEVLGQLSDEQLATLNDLLSRLPEDLPVAGAFSSMADALDALGLGSRQATVQFEQMARALDYIRQNGSISELGSEFDRVIGEVRDQLTLTFGDSLVGFLQKYYGDVAGFEDFRRGLEQVRFRLELAQLRAQFIILQGMGVLSDEIIAQFRAVFDFVDANEPDWDALANTSNIAATSVSSVADGFQQLVDRLARAKISIREFLDSLARGAAGGVTPEAGLAAARQQFLDLVARAQGGDINAIEGASQAAQDYLDLLRQQEASGPLFVQGFQEVQRLLNTLLNVTTVRDGNVATNTAAWQTNTLQTLQSGFGDLSHHGGEQVSLQRQMVGKLGEIVNEQKALGLKITTLEARARTVKAAA
jgi:TP901 family phage tail tape measure protein